MIHGLLLKGVTLAFLATGSEAEVPVNSQMASDSTAAAAAAAAVVVVVEVVVVVVEVLEGHRS